jgi:hypothetical protein
MLLAGPANAWFWCWPMVAIVEGPRYGSTVTTDTVTFRLVVSRPPTDVRSLQCTLTGPTTTTGCTPLVRDGWRSRSFSTFTATGLVDGKYDFVVKVVNRWGWVTDVDRRSFRVDVPDTARCSVTGDAGSFGSTDGQALTDALVAASAGDALQVRGTCDGTFAIDRSLTLTGVGGGATLDAGGTGTVLTVAPAVDVELRDLTITGGGAGGIVTQGALTLSGATSVTGNTKSMVDENFAFAFGGGILNDEGTLVLRDQASVSNNAISASGSMDDIAFGGGIFSTGDVQLLDDATVTGNSASTPDGGTAAGGGLYNESADVLIDGGTVSGNVASSTGGWPADARGGGIYTVGTMRLVDATVSGNRAEAAGTDAATADGGGIFKGDGSLELDGSTLVTSNQATATGTPAEALGGGVYADNRDGSLVLLGTASVTGNTLSAATVAGGGLYTRGAVPTVAGWTGSVSGNAPDDCEPNLPAASCV